MGEEAGVFAGDKCGRWRVGGDLVGDLVQKRYRPNEMKNRSPTRCLADQD